MLSSETLSAGEMSVCLDGTRRRCVGTVHTRSDLLLNQPLTRPIIYPAMVESRLMNHGSIPCGLETEV